jgi:hypothetical protein
MERVATIHISDRKFLICKMTKRESIILVLEDMYTVDFFMKIE